MKNATITRFWSRDHNQYIYYIHSETQNHAKSERIKKATIFHQVLTSEVFKRLIIREVRNRAQQPKRGGGYHDPETYHFRVLDKMENWDLFRWVLVPKSKKQKNQKILEALKNY